MLPTSAPSCPTRPYIDSCTSAHRRRMACMLHGVCGPGSACYSDGSCSKGYPNFRSHFGDRRQWVRMDILCIVVGGRSSEDGGQTYTRSTCEASRRGMTIAGSCRGR